MKGRLWTALGASAGMLIMILDAGTALNGAAEGISLCVRSIIPSLFPFFVLSALLTNALFGIKILRPLRKLCGIPPGGESLLIVGLLGGYPTGAQNVAQAWKQGAITRSDAERMLGICSNMGPAFLFGIVATQFENHWTPWVLWGIHISSCLIVGAMIPGRSSNTVDLQHFEKISITDAVLRSIRAISSVCAWVILFRMLITFLQRWFGWLLPGDALVIISGLLELTNGCCSLNQIQDTSLRFIAASGICAFGGICVALQTASVSGGLGMKQYMTSKILQSVISIILAYIIVEPHIEPVLVLAMIAIICREMKKRGRISVSVGV